MCCLGGPSPGHVLSNVSCCFSSLASPILPRAHKDPVTRQVLFRHRRRLQRFVGLISADPVAHRAPKGNRLAGLRRRVYHRRVPSASSPSWGGA